MKDFSEYSDEELIVFLREGTDVKEITEYILNKYKGLVKSRAASMFIIGGDTEDLIQEGMIGLFNALNDYDYGRDASFSTFAELCVSRQIYSAIEASNRKKHIPLNTYISLYSSADHNPDSEEEILLDKLSNMGVESPEELLIERESSDNLAKKIEEVLSPFEKKALDLHLTGLAYVEIAKILNKTEKATDNALQRCKAKIRKLI